MSIRVFRLNDIGFFEEMTDQLGFGDTNGWWYSLAAADLTGDGQPELVAGNRDLNGQIQGAPMVVGNNNASLSAFTISPESRRP
jgi:hypothetical protein